MAQPLTPEQAYRAGWNASKRTTTCDLDAADDRFTRKHGQAHRDDFIRGWVDFAADNPFTPTRQVAR